MQIMETSSGLTITKKERHFAEMIEEILPFTRFPECEV